MKDFEGALVAARGITKHYGGITALDDVSLEVLPAEIHALVGENGAGKSTLVKIMTGAETSDAGDVLISGEEIGALTQSKLRSTLDLSLANVQVSQAQLLVLDAQNALASAMANLNAILGSESDTQYDLVDESPASPQAAPPSAEDLVQLALRARPESTSSNAF